MKTQFICPHCKGQLKVDDNIIFLTKNDAGLSALVLLSPKLGDYNFKIHPSVEIKAGEHSNFICPICYENLNDEGLNNNLARIQKINEEGVKSDIVFSQIVGEKCTFELTKDDLEAHGDDVSNYFDYFSSMGEF